MSITLAQNYIIDFFLTFYRKQSRSKSPHANRKTAQQKPTPTAFAVEVGQTLRAEHSAYIRLTPCGAND